ncbi:MAG: cell division protein ZapA [Xanthomonadaceae bacterium]|jgi:cell division protein ZapA|nr:cell division protein ZapA [Xanthomonadaceae bacterium]MDE1957784.1 cell division protein ZapA [Xanthomonadaceae bacterium]MDE2176725.1 cell division protein ZapA [Xanthomonadaceae bacterium]MDE2245396.1 cell division protein ZapA [Xanthomonadaceae bacterium]
MSADSEPVALKLLDREFLVACSEQERPGLLAAAALLDAKMRELRAASRTPGFDRLAVLAALSLTHELVDLRQRHAVQERVLSEGLAALRQRLQAALDPG